MPAGVSSALSVSALATRLGLICLVLASCSHEVRRFYSSEPSIVPTLTAASRSDLHRLAGFSVVTPAYLREGVSSDPNCSYIPELKEAELYFASMPGAPMAVDVSESLDENHTHCPPCPDLVSAYDRKNVSGKEVLLSRAPSEESRSRIVAYFWLTDVFITLSLRHENVVVALPSPDELQAETLRIAESMIGKPGSSDSAPAER